MAIKTKELMVGNYLTFRECLEDGNIIPILVEEVHLYDDVFLGCILDSPDSDEIGIDYHLLDNDFVGIPITEDFLVANGFKQDKGVTHCKQYVFADDLHKIPQTVIQFSFYGDGVSADTLFKCWTKPESCDGENSSHICDLKYVHQMQNALRLCGIKKELKLK